MPPKKQNSGVKRLDGKAGDEAGLTEYERLQLAREREEKRLADRERDRAQLYIGTYWRYKVIYKKRNAALRLQRWFRSCRGRWEAEFVAALIEKRKAKAEARRRVTARQSRALEHYYRRSQKVTNHHTGQWHVEALLEARRAARQVEKVRKAERINSEAVAEVLEDIREATPRESVHERLQAMLEDVEQTVRAMEDRLPTLGTPREEGDTPRKKPPNTPKFVAFLTKKSGELAKFSPRIVGPSQPLKTDARGGRVYGGNSTTSLGRYDQRDYAAVMFHGKGPGGSEFRDPNWSVSEVARYVYHEPPKLRPGAFSPPSRAPATLLRYATSEAIPRDLTRSEKLTRFA